ncbi:MAG: trypsin-like peptidase domain-containing protein [Bacilli bacterium]|nr:trypsin-like peptidase domain-containing protein [Bacilli bacterium]
MRDRLVNFVVILLAFILGASGMYYFTSQNRGDVVSNVNKNVTITSEDSINESIQKIYDSVVVVKNYRNGRLAGYGSGFVYKKDEKYGYIMTNNHVVEGATEIKISLSNGDDVNAKVLGTDSYMDVAVVSIDADDVKAIAEIGESTKSKLGDTVFTVGTPVGLDYAGTVTKGIISGENREITINTNGTTYMMEAVQIDASINPGNSGGPLVNINGEVIGVNSVKLIEDSVEGMGFAIPIEVAMSQVSKLEKGEVIERPLIGVSTYDTSNTLLSSNTDGGVVVGSVQSGSDAEAAGFEQGDVIVKFDGIKVKSSAHLKFLLYKHNIGDSIKLTVIRNGKEKELTLKLTHKIGD